MTNADLAVLIAETLWKRSLIYSGDEHDVIVAVRTALDINRPEPEGWTATSPSWARITEDTDG